MFLLDYLMDRLGYQKKSSFVVKLPAVKRVVKKPAVKKTVRKPK